MDQILHSKGIEWLNGEKHNIHLYATYKTFTSDVRTHKTEGMEKDISC